MMPAADDSGERSSEHQPAARPADAVSPEYQRISITAEEWAGPLPPPEALERYEVLIPNAGERFMRLFESQSAHRLQTERRESRRLDAGLLAAFIVVVLIIAAGTFLVYSGYEWAGATMVGLDVVGLAALFIFGPPRLRSRRNS